MEAGLCSSSRWRGGTDEARDDRDGGDGHRRHVLVRRRVKRPTPVGGGSMRERSGSATSRSNSSSCCTRARRPHSRRVEFGADMACDDGTTQLWFVGLGVGRAASAAPRTLDADILDVHRSCISTEGASRPRRGHVRIRRSRVTADEQAKLCTTGELRWTGLLATCRRLRVRCRHLQHRRHRHRRRHRHPLPVLRFVTAKGERSR